MKTFHPASPAALGLLGLLVLSPLAACGTNEGASPDAENAEIAFTPEELRLLEAPDTVAAPSGPVSRENYRQQLESLEKEIETESRR